MKGIPALLTETSKLDANEEIRFRGILFRNCKNYQNYTTTGNHCPEGLFYLMMIGEIPEKEDVINISKDWATPCACSAIRFSTLLKRYRKTVVHDPIQHCNSVNGLRLGIPESLSCRVNKKFYWDFMYEDVMTLIARLPRIAAYIYRRIYHNGDHVANRPSTGLVTWHTWWASIAWR